MRLMRWGGLCAPIQSGKQAIEASLFALGTWGLLKRHVEQSVVTRFDDADVASLGQLALVVSRRLPQEAALIGLHGSLTEDEMAIPLLVDPGR